MYKRQVQAPPTQDPPPAPPPPRPAVITNPDWVRRPSGEDLARYFPDRASRNSISGRATINCQVTASGGLEGCSVVSEDPADYGFGEAALRMSRLFRMRPQSRDGVPVGGASVRIPITFRLAQ